MAGRFPTVNARPPIRIETLAACLLLLEATAWAEEAVPPAGFRHALETVYEDGRLLRDWRFAEVRERSNRTRA